MQLEENDLRKLLLYFDKATAWFYVSMAGLLNGIYITYEIFGKWGLPRTPGIFLSSILVIVVLCSLTVRYRLASKRKARKIADIRGE